MNGRRHPTATTLPAWGAHALFAALALLVTGARVEGQALPQPRVGETLARWTPGTLDIHQISTGRGNSALLILPDSTTLLVDAGAAADGTLPEIDPHPDASRSPGEWIARYVNRHLPDPAAGLDYGVITHFHIDHVGQVLNTSPVSANGNYKLSGITEVGDRVRVRTVIDRGWPDYNYPAPLRDSTFVNYRRFLEVQRARGLTVERFRAGARDQLLQRHAPARYPGVEVRNIVGNGELWTGSGEATRSLFPSLASVPAADWPSENMCSLGFRLTYGSFSYFTGGDLQEMPDPGFPAWHSVDSAIARAIGPVDVHVVNHHGSVGAEGTAVHGTLASKVLVIPIWGPIHPAPDVVKRIAGSRGGPTEQFVFVTDLRPAARTVNVQRAAVFSGPPGHVVVRVEPGGERYWVLVVTNADESGRILSVSGPFDSR